VSSKEIKARRAKGGGCRYKEAALRVQRICNLLFISAKITPEVIACAFGSAMHCMICMGSQHTEHSQSA
jgi:hypothetical protein